MQTRHKATTLAAALLLLIAGAVPSQAEDVWGCEVPLFVQQGSIDANVMILFDNSGSMNHMLYHRDYDSNTVYAGAFDPVRNYFINGDGHYAPVNVPNRPAAAVETTPTALLVRSFNASGRYRGNYLNWIFYTATDEQRDWIPTWARIHVAQSVVADIIARSDRVRFGLTIFNFNDGGQVVAPCGTDKAQLIDTVLHIVGNSWTPLGETLEDVLDVDAVVLHRVIASRRTRSRIVR